MLPYKEILKIIAKTYDLEKIIKLKDDDNDTSKVRKH